MSDQTTATPARIAVALRDLRGRVRRRFALHGTGWMIAGACATLLANYALDRLLVLPSVIRLLLLLVMLVYLLRGLQRRLLYPLSRPLSDSDLALLLERVHPDLHQEMVSAVQLDATRSRGDSPELIGVVQEQAAGRLTAIDLGSVLRPQRTRRVWGAAAGFAVLLGLSVLQSPDAFGVWLTRLFGASTPYPRRTFLSIEVPEGQGNYRVYADGPADSPIRVDLARGADLPINVDVRGLPPPTVDLVVTAGNGGQRRQAMSPRGPGHFRHVFRRMLHPMRLYAEGGDDPGTRAVEVRILVAPAVSELSVQVEPPAYTGLQATRREGGLVEGLPGSMVTVRFRSTEPLLASSLQFQVSGQRVDVREAAPQPAEPKAVPAADPTGGEYEATFVLPEQADRYRIHLEAKNGLADLTPGLHSVVPVPDRKPRLQILAPGPGLQALTPNATLPLRFLATDDYGLTKVGMTTKLGTTGTPHVTAPWQYAKTETAPIPPAKQSYLALVGVQTLLGSGERAPREGDRLALEIVAEDNRQPDPQASQAASLRLDLFDIEELRRRLQSRLRTTRETVERAAKVQAEQESRLENLLAELTEGSGVPDTRRKMGLSALEAGQQRVRGFLLQIRGDLGEVVDAHVFNGLDASPAVSDVIKVYADWFGKNPEAGATEPGFFVALDAARKSGAVGNLDLIGRLADMYMISHRLLDEHLDAALRGLAASSTADSETRFQGALTGVQTSQRAIRDGLNDLLRLLEDWNDFQDVVRMTRRLKDAQRELGERVRLGTGSGDDKKGTGK